MYKHMHTQSLRSCAVGCDAVRYQIFCLLTNALIFPSIHSDVTISWLQSTQAWIWFSPHGLIAIFRGFATLPRIKLQGETLQCCNILGENENDNENGSFNEKMAAWALKASLSQTK